MPLLTLTHTLVQPSVRRLAEIADTPAEEPRDVSCH